MKCHARPLGRNILVFDVRDMLRSQICQMGVSLGGKADICRNDGPKVILAVVRADVAE